MALAWLKVMAQVQDHPQLFPLTITSGSTVNPSPSLVIPALSIPPKFQKFLGNKQVLLLFPKTSCVSCFFEGGRMPGSALKDQSFGIQRFIYLRV